MMRNDDPNSAGFLAIILAGIMLVVGGLLLMGDAARWDRPTLVAERHQTSTLHKADQRRERF